MGECRKIAIKKTTNKYNGKIMVTKLQTVTHASAIGNIIHIQGKDAEGHEIRIDIDKKSTMLRNLKRLIGKNLGVPKRKPGSNGLNFYAEETVLKPEILEGLWVSGEYNKTLNEIQMRNPKILFDKKPVCPTSVHHGK